MASRLPAYCAGLCQSSLPRPHPSELSLGNSTVLAAQAGAPQAGPRQLLFINGHCISLHTGHNSPATGNVSSLKLS